MSASSCFFFNDTATTEIYTLSLHDALPISGVSNPYLSQVERGLRKPSAEILASIARGLKISAETLYEQAGILDRRTDRKSTRLNSSHANISYAVFCLKKKKHKTQSHTHTYK